MAAALLAAACSAAPTTTDVPVPTAGSQAPTTTAGAHDTTTTTTTGAAPISTTMPTAPEPAKAAAVAEQPDPSADEAPAGAGTDAEADGAAADETASSATADEATGDAAPDRQTAVPESVEPTAGNEPTVDTEPDDAGQMRLTADCYAAITGYIDSIAAVGQIVASLGGSWFNLVDRDPSGETLRNARTLTAAALAAWAPVEADCPNPDALLHPDEGLTPEWLREAITDQDQTAAIRGLWCAEAGLGWGETCNERTDIDTP